MELHPSVLEFLKRRIKEEKEEYKKKKRKRPVPCRRLQVKHRCDLVPGVRVGVLAFVISLEVTHFSVEPKIDGGRARPTVVPCCKRVGGRVILRFVELVVDRQRVVPAYNNAQCVRTTYTLHTKY